MSDPVGRLYEAVLATRDEPTPRSRTARLMRAGPAQMSKKLVEEIVEVVIDAVKRDRPAVARESADVLYHLVVLWAAAGVQPAEVWAEMKRREEMIGIAETLPELLTVRPVRSRSTTAKPRLRKAV